MNDNEISMERISPKVSVIVPCYNLATYLPDALNSVISQQYSNWECIVVDDGSTDESFEVAQSFASSDSRFRAISINNHGVAYARNLAASVSRGEYLLFLDADDILLPNYMTKAVAILDTKKKVNVVSGHAEQFGDGIKTKRMDLTPFTLEQLVARNCIYITSFIRRSVFEKTGGFSEDFLYCLEDWDFWLSAIRDDEEVIVLDDVVFRYRIRKGSRNTGIRQVDITAIRRLIWERHRFLYAQHFMNPMLTPEYLKAERYWKKYERLPGVRIHRLVTRLIHKVIPFY